MGSDHCRWVVVHRTIVPDADRVVHRCCRYHRAGRTEGDLSDRSRVTFEFLGLDVLGLQVPQVETMVATGARQLS